MTECGTRSVFSCVCAGEEAIIFVELCGSERHEMNTVSNRPSDSHNGEDQR